MADTKRKRLPGTIQTQSGRWEAGIQVDGRRIFLGTEAAREHHGEFARF